MLIKSRRGFLTGVGVMALTLTAGHAFADDSSPTIYLTFDDGYVGTADKARALAALGINGTFFLTGQAIEWHAGDAELALSLGNRIANHTYDHTALTRLSADQIVWEVQRCEQAANRVLGVSTAPYLHAPYFADNATVRAIVRSIGFTSVGTNWDTADWSGTSASYIGNRIRAGIVTMHTQGRNTIAALDAYVPDLLAQGYTFAVLS
ncbi:MAG TPA: polysaccharide deacetylase family protein [Dehalococcoidia bacterium]|nr:polysaccharide deacetylase family protein [Dehalococcoidia bacterium]